MIQANMDTVELKGEPADLVFETANVITSVVAHVAKESGYEPEEILADIINAISI